MTWNELNSTTDAVARRGALENFANNLFEMDSDMPGPMSRDSFDSVLEDMYRDEQHDARLNDDVVADLYELYCEKF